MCSFVFCYVDSKLPFCCFYPFKFSMFCLCPFSQFVKRLIMCSGILWLWLTYTFVHECKSLSDFNLSFITLIDPCWLSDFHVIYHTYRVIMAQWFSSVIYHTYGAMKAQWLISFSVKTVVCVQSSIETG